MPHPRLLFAFFAIAFLFAGALYIMRQQPVLACQSRRAQIEDAVHISATCQSDADCALLTNGCGTYTTCGESVAASALDGLTRQVEAFNQECSGFGLQSCISCVALRARCTDGICAVEEVR